MQKIPVAEPNLTDLEKDHLMEAFNSGWISSKGSFISRFEDIFGSYIGSKYALTTSNGTVSLHLILEALGIKKGDEVLVPSLTYIASVNAIRFVGADPVFIDVDPKTWNMDPDRIEEMISDRTKAIMGVHLYGNPLELKKIIDICDKHGIVLIEDAAEALGSEYDNKKIGSLGSAASFSFFGNKTVTTGEGGMVVTDDEELNEKMKIIKNQGNSKKKRYWHDLIGYNFRLTNLQAAIGFGQMERVEELVSRKRENAKIYESNLSPEKFQLPFESVKCKHSHWMYTILIRSLEHEEQRDDIIQKLEKDHGIETRPMFYPIHMMDIYKGTKRGDLEITEDIYYKGLSLPSSTLLNEENIKYISKVLNSIVEE